MVSLFNLKAGRLGYSLFPKTKRYAVGFVDLNPSHFDCSLQSLILCRLLASEISEPQPNFTANYLVNSCGLSPEGAVSASERVKLRSPEKADSVLALLRNRGFSATQISKLVRLCPQLLGTNPEKTLLPKLDFFTSLGASKDDLAKIIASSPAVLKTTFYSLKKLHAKKMKIVDRRASESRKIRYNVYEKMVNFMTPETMAVSPMLPDLNNLFGLKKQKPAFVVY